MSRTHNTDPYLIRAARSQGRSIPKDWRERWSYKHAPRWSDFEAFQEFEADRPYVQRGDADPERYSYREEERACRGSIRMRERECISHEDWDGFPPERRYFNWYW